MPHFKYVARDSNGKKVSGKIEVQNERNLYSYLKSENLFCIKYKELGIKKSLGKKKLKLKSVVILSKQFAAMLSSGVSIIKCLDILYNQVEDKKLKKHLYAIYETIQKGNTLSSALKQEGELFPPLFISMVRVGEESGNLERVFERLATHYDKEKELKDKTINAMIYPIILSVVSIIVMGILLVYVIPNFFEMFQADLESLPGSTRLLMGMSEGVRMYGYHIGVTLCSIILGIWMFKDTPQIKKIKDTLVLNMPVIGKLNRVIISARFAQTLSTLYASGLSLLESLEITQDVLNYSLLDASLNQMRENVSKGMPLWKAIQGIQVFPPMLSHMIEVGEESGRLDDMLEKTAIFYEQEADTAIKRMIAVIEPTMVVVLGLLVGFIVAALIPPIYSMYQNMT